MGTNFEFLSEKTNMILFNNGLGPKELSQFKLNGQDLLYKSEIKFLVVYLTTNLIEKGIWRQYCTRQGKALIC